MSNTTSTDIDPAALDPGALDKAVAESHAGAAPADADSQRMAALEKLVSALVDQLGERVNLSPALDARLADIEAFLDRTRPALEAMETLAAAEGMPVGVINRISALEVWAEDLLHHFQHKIPALQPGA